MTLPQSITPQKALLSSLLQRANFPAYHAAHAARHARRLSPSLGRLAALPAPVNDAGRPAHTGQLPPYLARLVAATPGLGAAIAVARARLDAVICHERIREALQKREALMMGGAA